MEGLYKRVMCWNQIQLGPIGHPLGNETMRDSTSLTSPIVAWLTFQVPLMVSSRVVESRGLFPLL